MENLVFTQLSITEVRQLFREELEGFFAERQFDGAPTGADELGGMELAVEMTGLTKPTIYGLVHGRRIPHSKRGKKLYFSRQDLTEWLKQGKRKTQAEIALDAIEFTANKKGDALTSPRK